MITEHQFDQLQAKSTVTVFSKRKQWETAVIQRINPTTATIRVKYEDKVEETHTRLTIQSS